jgi:hypothetical protein
MKWRGKLDLMHMKGSESNGIKKFGIQRYFTINHRRNLEECFMKKRMLSMILAVVMCLSVLPVSAFAAGSTSDNNSKEDVFYLSDGTKITVTISTIEPENGPSPRISTTVVGTATSKKVHTFNCYARNGDLAAITVENTDEDEDVKLKARIQISLQDEVIESVDKTYVLDQDEQASITVSKDNGIGLACTMTATVSPYMCDSAAYTYQAWQKWQ